MFTLCLEIKKEIRASVHSLRLIITKVLLIVFIAVIFGCSVVPIKSSEFDLPSQDINSPLEDNNYRIVFFNSSFILLYPFTATINIKLNQKHVATLKAGQYVQLYLSAGEYELYLDHWDVKTWKSDYKFAIDSDNTFVKVFTKMTSTDYEVVKSLPDDFESHYRPAYK